MWTWYFIKQNWKENALRDAFGVALFDNSNNGPGEDCSFNLSGKLKLYFGK